MSSRMIVHDFLLCMVLVGFTGLVYSAETCCGDLGCFKSDGDFFHVLYRPLNPAPVCDLISKFKLHLNTRANNVTTHILDPYDINTVNGSHFNFSQDTKVLIHGFTDNYAWPWWTDTKNELLKELEVNVISVEWSAGNLPPLMQAAANGRLLGAFVAKFINLIKKEFGYDPLKIHLIGHSLGAQVVGYVGERVVQIGRITGLDPAGMYFTNMPPSVRLDPTDAKVVDTIVTDIGTILNFAFGSSQAMGHLNFYANGGVAQPGCDQSTLGTLIGGPSSFNSTNYDTLATVTQTGYQAVMCNHYRALALFQETISSRKCGLKSYQCSDYDQFLQGKCFSCDGNRYCSNLGLHLHESLAEANQTKKYFTFTSDRPPYCTNTYQLKFSLLRKQIASDARSERGFVFVTIFGSRGVSDRFQLNAAEIDLLPGNDYGFLFHTTQEFGTILSVNFEWDARFSIFNPTEFLRRHYLYIADATLQLTNSNNFVVPLRLSTNQVEEEKVIRANAINL